MKLCGALHYKIGGYSFDHEHTLKYARKDIGLVINQHKSWGNKFIENLARDIKITFPDMTGYSIDLLFYNWICVSMW